VTGRHLTDEAFERTMTSWIDARAQGPAADDVLEAVRNRTGSLRPRPRWAVPEWWVPARVTGRMRLIPGPALILVLVGALLAALTALLVVGSPTPRPLPPPFGLAAPGSVAFVAGGDLWTANADGSGRHQVTSDPRADLTPVFSRDGARISFKRLAAEGSRPAWEEWGDLVVADADGRNEVVLDPMIHGQSPVTWSPDDAFVVYSKLVGDTDQVMVAATDGSSTRQVTSGPAPNWGPALSPDGQTIAFAKGFPVVRIYVIQADGTGEHPITAELADGFDLADWSPDGRTLVLGMGTYDFRADLFTVGLDGKPERRIVGTPGNDFGPSWAPDGRSIAYLSTAGPTWRVTVASPDGSGIHTISDFGNWYYPQWSPDARHVLAVDGRQGRGPPIVAILDPLGIDPPTTFELSDTTGLGRADMATWQRVAP
jgi:Tol biopolymer transport system component